MFFFDAFENYVCAPPGMLLPFEVCQPKSYDFLGLWMVTPLQDHILKSNDILVKKNVRFQARLIFGVQGTLNS